MNCPNCGVLCPPDGLCDCGYDFSTGKMPAKGNPSHATASELGPSPEWMTPKNAIVGSTIAACTAVLAAALIEPARHSSLILALGAIYLAHVSRRLITKQSGLPGRKRSILALVLGYVVVAVFAVERFSGSRITPQSAPSYSAQVFETSGAFGLIAKSSDDPAERLKGLDAAQAREYGRLYALSFMKSVMDSMRSAVGDKGALEAFNELHRMRGEREDTAQEVESRLKNASAPAMASTDRSRIATKAASIGIPVEARNAFFDGYALGIAEINSRDRRY